MSEATPPANRNALFIVFLVSSSTCSASASSCRCCRCSHHLRPKRCCPPGPARGRRRDCCLLMASFSAMQFIFAPSGPSSATAPAGAHSVARLAGSVVFYLLFGYAPTCPRPTPKRLASL